MQFLIEPTVLPCWQLKLKTTKQMLGYLCLLYCPILHSVQEFDWLITNPRCLPLYLHII